MDEQRWPPPATKTMTADEHMEAGFMALDTARIGQPGAERAAALATAHFTAAGAILALADAGAHRRKARWDG